MITLAAVYTLAGLCFLAFAVLGARDAANPRRWGNAAFWALLALSMLAGDRLGDVGNGVLVLALVAIAGYTRARRAGLLRSRCKLGDTRNVLIYLWVVAALAAAATPLWVMVWARVFGWTAG